MIHLTIPEDGGRVLKVLVIGKGGRSTLFAGSSSSRRR